MRRESSVAMENCNTVEPHYYGHPLDQVMVPVLIIRRCPPLSVNVVRVSIYFRH